MNKPIRGQSLKFMVIDEMAPHMKTSSFLTVYFYSHNRRRSVGDLFMSDAEYNPSLSFSQISKVILHSR